MERGGNFLENLDDGEQMLALALELGNARLECGGERHGIVSSPADAASSCRARARAIASEPMRSLIVAACVAVPALAAQGRPSPAAPPLGAPLQERWPGLRLGPDSTAGRLSGIPRVLPTDSLDDALAAALFRVRGPLYVPLDQTTRDEQRIRELTFAGRDVRNLRPSADSMRLVKDADEIARMRKAVDISVLGHVAAMQAARPGVWEYEIEAVLEAAFRRNGADRVGYPSIVGSGPNSTTLHYDVSRRQIRDGDLVVVDAGAEWGQYTADVTRTFPVNGKFTPRQKAIYDLVLATQQAAFDSTRPGTTIAQLNRVARDYMRTHSGTLCGAETCDSYFIHGLSHWLGMDVHDVGDYGTPLKAGMVLTIEPGIYLAQESLGVRIEDDVLVTATGAEWLSAKAPRTTAEIERLMGRR